LRVFHHPPELLTLVLAKWKVVAVDAIQVGFSFLVPCTKGVCDSLLGSQMKYIASLRKARSVAATLASNASGIRRDKNGFPHTRGTDNKGELPERNVGKPLKLYELSLNRR
jgi:hypothetical protein